MAENPDVIQVDDVIEQLTALGLPVESIAAATGQTTERVTAAVTYHRPIRTPEETALADDLRRLTHKAIRQADLFLTFGTNEVKLKIVTALLSSANRSAAAEPAGGHDEMRIQFEQMVAEMREVEDVPSSQLNATPALSFVKGGDDGTPAQAAAEATHDQDEIPRDEEVRFGLRPPYGG